MTIEEEDAGVSREQNISKDVMIKLHVNGRDVVAVPVEFLLQKGEENAASSPHSRLCEFAISTSNTHNRRKTVGSNRFVAAAAGLGRSVVTNRKKTSLLDLESGREAVATTAAETGESFDPVKDEYEVQMVYTAEEGDKVILTSDEGTMEALSWASEQAGKRTGDPFSLEIAASVTNRNDPSALIPLGTNRRTALQLRKFVKSIKKPSPVTVQRGKERINAATSVALDNVFSAMNSAAEVWKDRQGPPEENIRTLKSTGLDRKLEMGAVTVLDNVCGAIHTAKKVLHQHAPPTVNHNNTRVADCSLLPTLPKPHPPSTVELPPLEQLSFEPIQQHQLIPPQSPPQTRTQQDNFEKVDVVVAPCILDSPTDSTSPLRARTITQDDQPKEDLPGPSSDLLPTDEISTQEHNPAFISEDDDDNASFGDYEDIPDASPLQEITPLQHLLSTSEAGHCLPHHGEDEWCVLEM